jgi:murein DD-endopeptidase MepM/ murein hydrolase activator NlpD
MRRTAIALTVLGLAVAAAPAAGDVYTRKHQVDARIAALHARIAQTHARVQALSSEIDSVTGRIHALESRVGDVSARLATLQADLALHQRKLGRLQALFHLETQRYFFLRRQYNLSVQRLSTRLVEVYEQGDVDTLDVILSAESLGDLIDGIDYLDQIGAQDRHIATSVGHAKDAAHAARERTRKVRAVVAAETRAVAVRTEQVRQVRDQLVSNRQALISSRSSKRVSLAKLSSSERQEVGEAQALEQTSAALTAQIQAAQSSTASAYSASTARTSHSSSGFIWPVSGPVVSGFGMRWGRMHTGIDIAVGYGTPIHAAAAGRVIYAGWMDGYGNLVFIDHGGGISTGYAHQSSIAVSNGQTVSQGQVIGYVGCTGHCFGPHLHFEVRVNGSPVDPLGYL